MEERDLRQAMLVLESYKEQLEGLYQQMTMLQTSLEESVRARETLKAFKDAKEGDEVLVPVGASVFITAKVTDKKDAIVGIGNKISIEKEIPEAEEFMSSIVIELQESLKRINKTYSELQTTANNLAMAVNAEYESQQNV